MNKPISVSTLNNQIKSLLETTFVSVYVEGEITGLTYHNSGHIYFSIKDDKSVISCVMFKGNARYLKFKLENGLKINIYGNISLYVPRGNYQILCSKIEPSGVGALTLAYEQLKTKLNNKGYFDQIHKKQMPRFVKTIVIITSNSGAAIEDMKKIASHRWPLVKIILIPTIVQGSNSAMDIAKNIKLADSLSADVIIVGRGGGSIEDLWGFNEEVVADAIFEAKTPIVSAVGHESDVVISDFVADLRASTPSNAIELLLPDINEYRFYIDELYNKLNLGFKRVIIDKTKEINHLFDSFVSNSFENRFTLISKEIETIKGYFDKNFIDTLNIKSQELDNLTLQYDRYIQNIFIQKQQTLDNLSQGYEIHNPKTKNKDGIGYISKDGKKSNIEELKKDDEFEVENQKVTIKAKVLDKIWIK